MTWGCAVPAYVCVVWVKYIGLVSLDMLMHLVDPYHNSDRMHCRCPYIALILPF